MSDLFLLSHLYYIEKVVVIVNNSMLNFQWKYPVSLGSQNNGSRNMSVCVFVVVVVRNRG